MVLRVPWLYTLGGGYSIEPERVRRPMNWQGHWVVRGMDPSNSGELQRGQGKKGVDGRGALGRWYVIPLWVTPGLGR